MRPDACYLAVTGCTMDCNILAKSVPVADNGPRHAALPLQILRLQPDARERINLVLLAQRRVPVNDHVRMQPAAFSQSDVFPDDAERTNLAIRPDFCLGMYD